MKEHGFAWLLISQGGERQALGLLPGLLEALQGIQNADSATVEWQDALKILLVSLDLNSKPPGVDDDDWKALTAAWVDLKDKLRGEVPSRLRLLTFKLAEFFAASQETDSTVKNPLSYPLTATASAAGAPVFDGVVINTSAEAAATATIALQVYEKAPEALEEASQTVASGEYFVRLGVRGDLSASASGKATPTWGKVSGDFSSTATAFFDTYFHFPSSRYIAKMLTEALPQVVAPGDLGRLLEVCAQPPDIGDFAMFVMELAGTLSLGGSVGLGVSVAGSFGKDLAVWSKTNGAKPASISAELALSAKFRWSIQGAYEVIAYQHGKAARVKLRRVQGSSSASSISAGAVIDVEGLQALLDPVLARILPASEPLTSRLGKLGDLRGLALDAVSSKLGIDGSRDWDKVATNLLDIAGGASLGPAKAALAEAIATQLDDVARKRLARKDVVLDQAPQAVVDLLKAFGLAGGQWEQGVAQKVEQFAVEIDAQVSAAYEKFKVAVTSEAAGSVASILSVPNKAGSTLIAELQGRADAFTTPLVEWIAKYEDTRRKFANAIAKIETEKLALSFALSTARSTEALTILEVEFRVHSAASSRLYSAICTGQLGQYSALLEACGADVSEVSWFDSVSQTKKVSSSLVIDLFGWQTLEATLSSLNQVSVGVDRSGRVVAASAGTSLTSVMKVRGKSTKAVVDLNLELLTAGATTTPLAAVYSAAADDFTRADEAIFYALLTASGVVSAGAADRMQALLWSGKAASSSKLKDTEVSVLYQPDAEAWQRLLAVAPTEIESRVRETGIQLAGHAVRAGFEPPLSGEFKDQISSWLYSTGLTEIQFWQKAPKTNWYTFFNELVILADSGPSPRGGQLAKEPSVPRDADQRLIYCVWQIARMSQAAGNAWNRVGEAAALIEKLRVSGAGVSRDEAYERLSELSERIRNDLVQVFDRVVPDVDKSTKVSWQYLALVLTLARLGAGDRGLRMFTKGRTKVDGVDSTFLVS